MKKLGLILVLSFIFIIIANIIWADEVTNEKDVIFGTNFFKSSNSIRLNWLVARWDKEGLTYVRYRLTPFRGDFYFNDVYIVVKVNDKDEMIYKKSDHAKMNILMGKYALGNNKLPKKHYEDELFFTSAFAKSSSSNTSIWWAVDTLLENGETASYYVIWDVAKNEINWYLAKDKPSPMSIPAPAPPPAQPAAPQTPPAPLAPAAPPAPAAPAAPAPTPAPAPPGH